MSQTADETTASSAPAGSTRGAADPRARGSVRRAPGPPGPGLPVLPELREVFERAAARPVPEPPGGGPTLLSAADAHGRRRGHAAGARYTAAAPGAGALLLAIAGRLEGDVLVPRPCPSWWIPGLRLLGRPVYTVVTPADSGGVPDPYALLETVRRIRAEGGRPRLLVLSPADDPTGTVPAPEAVHETVEAAVAEGLHIVSDETWRDTLHRPADGGSRFHAGGDRSRRGGGNGPAGGTTYAAADRTVLVSPAEMVPEHVTVLTDLAGAWLPPSWPAAVARFPGTARGGALRDGTVDLLTAMGATLAAPVAEAARFALDEPSAVIDRVRASARLHGRIATAVHDILGAAGVLVRPASAGRQLYADLGPFAGRLARHGVSDAQDLEDFLHEAFVLSGAEGIITPGGHRFGDDPDALRVRLSTTDFLPGTDAERSAALTAPDPLELPQVRRQLGLLTAVLADLAGGR